MCSGGPSFGRLSSSSTVIEPLVFLVCALIFTLLMFGVTSVVPSPACTANGVTGMAMSTSRFQRR